MRKLSKWRLVYRDADEINRRLVASSASAREKLRLAVNRQALNHRAVFETLVAWAATFERAPDRSIKPGGGTF